MLESEEAEKRDEAAHAGAGSKSNTPVLHSRLRQSTQGPRYYHHVFNKEADDNLHTQALEYTASVNNSLNRIGNNTINFLERVIQSKICIDPEGRE